MQVGGEPNPVSERLARAPQGARKPAASQASGWRWEVIDGEGPGASGREKRPPAAAARAAPDAPEVRQPPVLAHVVPGRCVFVFSLKMTLGQVCTTPEPARSEVIWPLPPRDSQAYRLMSLARSVLTREGRVKEAAVTDGREGPSARVKRRCRRSAGQQSGASAGGVLIEEI